MNNIVKVSRVIKSLLVLILIGHIGAFMFAANSDDTHHVYKVENAAGEQVFSKTLSVPRTWQAYAESLQAEGFNSILLLVGPELILYGLIYWWLFRLFDRYQHGEVFMPSSIRFIRNIGTCLLIWPLFTILYPILLTLLIRASGLSEDLPLFVSFGSSEMVKLLLGLIIFVHAWIMHEACSLKQDQELTI